MLRRAANAARGALHHPVMYPALRVRARAHRLPAQALVELGFAPDEVEAARAEYLQVAAVLYPALAERWRELMGTGPLFEKLSNPSADQNASNEIVYLTVRLARPEVVVETGTFGGLLSSFILRALDDNGVGRLVSLDLPAYQPIERAIDISLPAGHGPGFLIPDDLRGRLELVLGDTRETLPPTLDALGSIDLYVYDSLQTYRHMMFEYTSALRAIRPGGLIFGNNAFVTSAFWRFTRRHRLPLAFVGGDFGVTRAPR